MLMDRAFLPKQLLRSNTQHAQLSFQKTHQTQKNAFIASLTKRKYTCLMSSKLCSLQETWTAIARYQRKSSSKNRHLTRQRLKKDLHCCNADQSNLEDQLLTLTIIALQVSQARRCASCAVLHCHQTAIEKKWAHLQTNRSSIVLPISFSSKIVDQGKLIAILTCLSQAQKWNSMTKIFPKNP